MSLQQAKSSSDEPRYRYSRSALTVRRRLRIKARRTARELYWSEFQKDSAECVSCGTSDNLEVHHRDGDVLNNHIINLIAVCNRCHYAEHHRRSTRTRLDDWKRQGRALGNGGDGFDT